MKDALKEILCEINEGQESELSKNEIISKIIFERDPSKSLLKLNLKVSKIINEPNNANSLSKINAIFLRALEEIKMHSKEIASSGASSSQEAASAATSPAVQAALSPLAYDDYGDQGGGDDDYGYQDYGYQDNDSAHDDSILSPNNSDPVEQEKADTTNGNNTPKRKFVIDTDDEDETSASIAVSSITKKQKTAHSGNAANSSSVPFMGSSSASKQTSTSTLTIGGKNITSSVEEEGVNNRAIVNKPKAPKSRLQLAVGKGGSAVKKNSSKQKDRYKQTESIKAKDKNRKLKDADKASVESSSVVSKETISTERQKPIEKRARILELDSDSDSDNDETILTTRNVVASKSTTASKSITTKAPSATQKGKTISVVVPNAKGSAAPIYLKAKPPVNASIVSARKRNGDSVPATSNSASSKHNAPIEFGQVMIPSGVQHVMRASEVQQPRKLIVAGNSKKRKQESRGADENNNTATTHSSKIAKLTATKTSEIVKSTTHKASDTHANQTKVPRTKSSNQTSTTRKPASHSTSVFDMMPLGRADILSAAANDSSQKKRKIEAVDDEENDDAVPASSSSTTSKTTRDLKRGKPASSNEGIARRKAAAKPVSYAEKNSDDSDIAEENSDDSQSSDSEDSNDSEGENNSASDNRSVGSLWEGLSDEEAGEKLADHAITNDSSDEESDDESIAKKPVKKAQFTPLTDAQKELIKNIRIENSKITHGHIATRVKCDKSQVYDYIQELTCNGQVDRQLQSITNEKRDQIKKLRLENIKLTYQEIAKKVGCNAGQVHSCINELIQNGQLPRKKSNFQYKGSSK